MNFREFITKNSTLILAGRDAENNEELIKQVAPDEEVFHTESAGSPFVNIKGEPKKGDRKIAAIFCAVYSKEWKKNKSDVIVHRFKGENIYKDKNMKAGTFGVKKFRETIVKKKEIEEFILQRRDK